MLRTVSMVGLSTGVLTLVWLAAGAAMADAANRSMKVIVHYNARVVTKITYQSPDGRRTVHFPAHQGVVELAMALGPGGICYTTGNAVRWERHRTEKWYGVGFNATAAGLAEFGQPSRGANGRFLPKGDLKQTGKLTICIGVDPPRKRQGPVALSNHPQLFLDDHLVADLAGLKRRITQATKHPGNPVAIKQDHPWEAARVRCGTVIYEPEIGKFRLWYTAYSDKPGDNPGRCCYAESDDGITWRKPMLNILPFKGKLPTNLLLCAPAETRHISVIRTPHDPKYPYRAVFAHRNFRPITPLSGIFTSKSADGIVWTKPAHVGLGKCDNPPSVVWLDRIGTYVLATRSQASDPKFRGYWRVTGISESRDFTHWTPKKSFILTDDRDGYPFAQFHDIQQMVYGDIVIGAASVMHLTDKSGKNNKSATANVQLVTTRNGWQWNRVADRAVFLDNGPGDYDRIMALATSAMTVKDDTVYLYYHGVGKMNRQRWQAYRAKHGKKARRLLRALCLATLPADRFVALVPAARGKPGVLQTKVFKAEGRELVVNAELTNPGDLTVEVLDGSGKTLAGFEPTRSQLAVRDKLRYGVVWDGNGRRKTLKDALATGPMALRFRLRRGALYAFQVLK